jgi:hypothetical protein
MDRPDERDEGRRALERHDREQALSHHLDRLAPDRRAHWPKDDRRSSEHPFEPPPYLTDGERGDRWPIG